jgi:hypothetical protein
VSLPTISRLLQAQNYSLRVNHKRLAGKPSPQRDQQFRYLVRFRQAYICVKSAQGRTTELCFPHAASRTVHASLPAHGAPPVLPASPQTASRAKAG